jgi:hypothetical protein
MLGVKQPPSTKPRKPSTKPRKPSIKPRKPSNSPRKPSIKPRKPSNSQSYSQDSILLYIVNIANQKSHQNKESVLKYRKYRKARTYLLTAQKNKNFAQASAVARTSLTLRCARPKPPALDNK